MITNNHMMMLKEDKICLGTWEYIYNKTRSNTRNGILANIRSWPFISWVWGLISSQGHVFVKIIFFRPQAVENFSILRLTMSRRNEPWKPLKVLATVRQSNLYFTKVYMSLSEINVTNNFSWNIILGSRLFLFVCVPCNVWENYILWNLLV